MVFFFQAEDGIRDLVRSRGLGDVYKRQAYGFTYYSGFSEQLLNLNWSDPDLRREMIRMLSYLSLIHI